MVSPGERTEAELNQYGEYTRLTRPTLGFSSVMNMQTQEEGVWQVEGCQIPTDDCGGLVLTPAV